jgi:hypothetical protein
MAAHALAFHALWSVWAAAALYNVWRLAGAAFFVHVVIMREFDAAAAGA